jgi:surface polysaccharide O-acyltransferase-like enzyme
MNALFMPRNLPRAITSYDVLKTAALLLMIVDHVGYYFHPDEMWWRVFGRLCVPMWFFLVGYARSRDLSAPLWIGAAVLVAGNMVAGMYIFPLNILPTILFVRLALDPVMGFAGRGRAHLWGVMAALAALAIPTFMLTEYGTVGLLLAMVGYAVRQRQDGAAAPERDTIAAFALLVFIVTQFWTFGFDQAQMIVMSGGLLAVTIRLLSFRPQVFAGTDGPAWRPARAVLGVTGRHTLALYVWHLLLFKALAMVLFPADHAFMAWTWFFT